MPDSREEGVAGFFEDIPVLIIVTIATAIFLYSLVHAYAVYLDCLETQTMQDEARHLGRALRGYEKLAAGGEEGVISGEKLVVLTTESLREDFDPRTLGYQYQVSIIDTSDHPDFMDYTRSFATSEFPSRGNRFSETTSVLIRVGETYHAAQLTITIWR